jgi:hypothetical protein
MHPYLVERYGLDKNKGYGAKKHMDGYANTELRNGTGSRIVLANFLEKSSQKQKDWMRFEED